MRKDYPLDQLEECLKKLRDSNPECDAQKSIVHQMKTLLKQGLDQLPYPGEGQTYRRWQALARMAAGDLSLAKIFESHTDALAIMHELNVEPPMAEGIWSMWAAEPPDAKVFAEYGNDETIVRLNGVKAWCSGASYIDNALMTAWMDDEQYLVAFPLTHEGIRLVGDKWQAEGMKATDTIDVHFKDVPATLVGKAGDYLKRPGFWHGGAGIAACWYGASQGLGETLQAYCSRRDDPYAWAHLGAVDAGLHTAQLALQHCADWIDQNPLENAELAARRVRNICEKTGDDVIGRTGNVLGAALYCRDRQMAQRLRDIPVYLRLSHGDHDLAAEGKLVEKSKKRSWQL